MIQLQPTLARTYAERLWGFSLRTSVGINEAIFFAFPSDVTHAFTMMNTLVPLDIMFFDERGRSVAAFRYARPRDERPYGSSVPYRYVLEVPGGWLTAHGVEDDTVAKWSAFEPPT